MLKESKKRIGQVIFVVGYAIDSTIRTKQFDIEKALAPLITGPSINTNLPDEHNPHAPRVQIGKGRISAQFTQLAAQLTINVENANGKPLETIRDSITKKINLFQNCLDKIVPHDQQRERGLVLVVQYPVDSVKFSEEQVINYLHTNFFRFDPLGVAVNTGFNAGYRTEYKSGSTRC
jgi:hypothetical protein